MSIRKTITSIFMVPTLGINREKLVENGYINGYLSDSRRDVQHRNVVYLLFKPANLDKFREFLDNEYERTTYMVDDYDYEDGYVVSSIWTQSYVERRLYAYQRRFVFSHL